MGDRRDPLALAALTAALVAVVLLQGGFYLPQALLAAAVFVGGVIASRPTIATPPLARMAFGALAAGMGVSIVANGWSEGTAKPVVTWLIAIAATELAARTVRADGRRAVLDVVVLVAAGAALVGLVGVAWHIVPLGARANPWRLQSTLTYQNAAGSLFVLALMPAVALAGSGRAARAAAALIVAGLGATLSRGAFVAAAVAVVISVALRRPAFAELVRPLPGALVILAGVVPAMLEWPGGAAIGTVAIAAGIVIAAVAPAVRIPKVAAALAIVALVVAGAAVVSTTALRGRITVSSGDRARVWSETWARLDNHLVAGTGPGTYELIARRDRLIVRTEYAHNEYLQTLSETGVVGITSVALALGFFVACALRSRARVEAHLWAACVASCAAFVAHSALDFLWRLPALVAVGFVLFACATVEEAEGSSAEARKAASPR